LLELNRKQFRGKKMTGAVGVAARMNDSLRTWREGGILRIVFALK
jgi:hypothetical protein